MISLVLKWQLGMLAELEVDALYHAIVMHFFTLESLACECISGMNAY